MRRAAFAFAAAAFFALPAAADPVTLAPASFSTEFQEKLEDDLGVREGGVLQRAIDAALTRALSSQGAEISDAAPVTVETVIEDARESRPTFQQLTDEPSLSYMGSRSLGGAELTGIIRGADGRELARVEHRFYEAYMDFTMPDRWGDARRAINQYARKVAAAYRGL